MGRSRSANGLGERPAAIWRFPAARDLATLSMVCTGAFYQSDWGMPHLKPTRLLGRLDSLEGILCQGWPTFSNDGIYQGPLASTPKAPRSLIGKAAPGGFNTGPTATWPPQLCGTVAELLLDHFHMGTRGQTSILAKGEHLVDEVARDTKRMPARRHVLPDDR